MSRNNASETIKGPLSPSIHTQDDWKSKNFNRLACPVQVTYPHLVTSKTCESGELNLPHLRDHLKKKHSCNCELPGPCKSNLHLSSTQLADVVAITKQRSEEPHQTWRRIYEVIYPAKKPAPTPFLVTFDQVKAVVARPTIETREQFYHELQTQAKAGHSIQEGSSTAPDIFQQFGALLTVIHRTGALPATLPSLGEP